MAGAIAPIMGCRVCFNNTTGEINFLPAGTTVPAGYTQLQAAVVNVYTFTNQIDIDFFIPQAS